MLPVLELRCTDIEGTALYLTQSHVGGSDLELTARVTHGSAAITTTTGLVEKQFPVLGAERPDQGRSRRRDRYP